MINWQQHLDKYPERYKWDQLWSSKNARDKVGQPHQNIYIGSYCSTIPDNITAILNVAEELENRIDIDIKIKYKIGLIDPGMYKDDFKQFNKAIQLLCHLVDFSYEIVFVHCNSGMNRAVSVAATASAILDHVTVIDKIKQIAKNRPEIWPEPYYIIMGQIINGELTNGDD